MRVSVGDCRLYVDVEGLGLVPDGSTMRQRPTVLVLHGGPGFDRIERRVLLLSGRDDPVTPVPCAKLIAAGIGPELCTLEVFEDCGHGVWRDQPGPAFDAMRRFIG